jgi:hypothetical protein
MGNINIGSQDVLWHFRYPVVGIHNQKALRDIIDEGIFKGMEVSILESTNRKIRINKGVACFKGKFNYIDQVLCKINFDLHFDLIVPQTTVGENMIVYMTYDYEEVIQNYANVLYTTKSDFISNRPLNCVVLCEIIYDSNSYIIDIDYELRMERNVSLINEYGFISNKQGNKFLYTNGKVDRNFETPDIGHIAVIQELTIEDGIEFTIKDDKEVLILGSNNITDKLYSGKIKDVILQPYETKYFVFGNCKTVIANFSRLYDNETKLFSNNNIVFVKNESDYSKITEFNYIVMNV